MKTLVAIASLLAGCATFQVQDQKPDARKPKRVEIAITDKGLTPEKVEVAAGVPIELVFTRQTDKTCATEIEVPSLKVKKPLPLNEPVAITLTPVKDDIAFACGMNMLKGKLVVK